MGAVVDLDRLLDQRRVWRGRQARARPLACSPRAMLPLTSACRKAVGRRLRSANCCWPAPAVANCSCCGQPRPFECRGQPNRTGGTAIHSLRPGTAGAGWTCAGWYRWPPNLQMPCGLPSSACVPAVAQRCCAGRSVPMTAPCGACRWLPKPARRWPSPAGRNRRRITLHLQRCALPSTPVRHNGAC